MFSESELEFSDADSEYDDDYMCMFEEFKNEFNFEKENEEFKYVNLGWPQECHKCHKMVSEKYYTKTIVNCKPCYKERQSELELEKQSEICASELQNNSNFNFGKQKSSSLIIINCELELNKENRVPVIREVLVPVQFRQKLAKHVVILQFDTRTITLTHYVNNMPMRIEKKLFTLPLTFISPVGSYPFILGLHFLKSIAGFYYAVPNITFFNKGITTIDQSNLIESYNNVNIEEHNPNIEEITEDVDNIETQIDFEFDEVIFEHEYPKI